VTDIEGTTTPITFVHDVLFGYVKSHLISFLEEHWEETECQDKISVLRSQAEKDVAEKVPNVVPIPSPKDSSFTKKDLQDAVIKNIQWQMSIDRKIAALKDFQGYMWRTAYDSGEIKAS
jgi:enolase-phosphatase E1